MEIVPADHLFADNQHESAKELMSNGVVQTSQSDVGFPFRSDKRDIAFVTSWTRPSNDIMVSRPEDMKPIEDMSLEQTLCAGIRSDLPDEKKRVCLSYAIAGLFASSFLMDTVVDNEAIKIPPLIVDMIPLFDRKIGSTEEDFCVKNGSVDISHGLPIIKKRISYILRNFLRIFTEGTEVLNAFIGCIREEGHIVKFLNDEDMAVLDPQFNNLRRKTGATSLLKALLVQHCDTGKTIALYNCMQISTAIGGVSAYVLK
jgi:hypothetical protein